MSKLINKTTLSIATLSLFAVLFVGSGGDGDCFVCDGAGRNDCAICVNGKTEYGGKKSTCTFCNGRGTSTCTFCDGSGKSN